MVAAGTVIRWRRAQGLVGGAILVGLVLAGCGSTQQPAEPTTGPESGEVAGTEVPTLEAVAQSNAATVVAEASPGGETAASPAASPEVGLTAGGSPVAASPAPLDQVTIGTVEADLEEADEEAPAADEPEDVATLDVAIDGGQLTGANLSGIIGTAVEMNVTGDGTEHTISIEGLLDDETIAAEGETQLGFTVEGEPGDRAIQIDGADAGTFAVQDAAGSTDDPNAAGDAP